MLSRKIELEKDYKEIANWWTKQDWPVMPTSMLCDDGFIVEDDENKLAACWVFSTNCPIYIMEWTVGNPDVDWETRQKALDMLIATCVEWSKDNGAEFLFTMTKRGRFLDKLKDNEFKETDEDMVHLMRRV